MKRYKQTYYTPNGKYKIFGILFTDNALPLIHVDTLKGKKKRITFNYTNKSKLPNYIVEICEHVQQTLINQSKGLL